MRVGIVLVVLLLPLWPSLAPAQQEPAQGAGSLAILQPSTTAVTYPALHGRIDQRHCEPASNWTSVATGGAVLNFASYPQPAALAKPLSRHSVSVSWQRARKITENQNGGRKNERFYVGGFEVYREYSSGSAPSTERQTLNVELARALATEPQLLLLDERAAGLNPQETAELGKLIIAISRLGVTILMVEHHMDLVMSISDHVIVLDYGVMIA